MAEELKQPQSHDANVFLPGCLGPVKREVILLSDFEDYVAATRQGGEAVEVVARIIESPSAIFPAVELTQSGVGIWGTHDLMTVAQHQRIIAAANRPADPGAVAVRRELLERLAHADQKLRYSTMEETRYWLDQYRQIARALLADSEGVKP